nr:pentapeptide repeat-containing protein [uncultured Cohaesibacter sp.]
MPNSKIEGSEAKSLPKAGDPISKPDAAKQVLLSRADLSYQFFDGVQIDNVVARQSLFHGALFRNCKISDADFSRSDFEGARFENCELCNVSFETADVRSTKFARTRLVSCTLRSSVCSDNVFRECVIEDCDLEEAAIQRSTFHQCDLRLLKNRKSTWLQSTFRGSRLASLSFSDCTASYTIFDECSFRDVTINADALGISFGLTETNLNELQFGFLGQSYGAGVTPGLDQFLKQYRDRNWLFHANMLALNFRPSIRLPAFIALVDELSSQARRSAGLKRDDVEFYFRVMGHLQTRQELPFAAAIYAHDEFSKLREDIEESADELPTIEYGLQQALYLASKMHDRLLEATLPIVRSNPSHLIEATLTYRERPQISTLGYLETVQAISSVQDNKPRLLEARQGSWIEIIQISLSSLFALYVALYLVNGCLAQLTMVRARTKKLLAKRLPNKFLRAASDPSHELPKPYQDILTKLLISQISGDAHIRDALAALKHNDVEGMLIDVKELST